MGQGIWNGQESLQERTVNNTIIVACLQHALVGREGAPETGGDAPAVKVTVKVGVAWLAIPLVMALKGGIMGLVAVSVIGDDPVEFKPGTAGGAGVAPVAAADNTPDDELDDELDDGLDDELDDVDDEAENDRPDEDWRARSTRSWCERFR